MTYHPSGIENSIEECMTRVSLGQGYLLEVRDMLSSCKMEIVALRIERQCLYDRIHELDKDLDELQQAYSEDV